jgi:NAD(P)-dependent dehydrogenase (short-subunit alcohol dehydrogenase family)
MSMADPEEFAGRVALVTAAAGKGIGQAIARRLAAGGARVVVTDIHAARTKQVTAEIAADYPAATVVGYPMDAGDRVQIDAVVDEVTASLGPVRILVNNAAVNVVGSIFGYDPANWDWAMRVNLSGPWYLCYRTMPLMRDVGGGVIVNIGSYAPDVGGSGVEAPYASSKGGLAALTRGLARARDSRHRRSGGLPRVGPGRVHHRRGAERRGRFLHADLTPMTISVKGAPCPTM